MRPCGCDAAGSSYYKMRAGLNGFDPKNRLGGWRCKDWHGLHESSYCYFEVYAGTRNLKTADFFIFYFLFFFYLFIFFMNVYAEEQRYNSSMIMLI